MQQSGSVWSTTSLTRHLPNPVLGEEGLTLPAARLAPPDRAEFPDAFLCLFTAPFLSAACLSALNEKLYNSASAM
jgi:hypothetical protein